jgi:D-cysteine desulfhydrase
MISRIPLAHLPTPIEELPRLSKALGGPKILIKRDDQTGLAFGGNKTRKLEFLLGEAKKQGAKMLISCGAIQSNHCRQTAAAAAKFGFECVLILTGEKPKKPSANFLLDQLFGAKIITVLDRKDRDSVLQKTFDEAKAQNKKPYLVPYGGSSPVGALGYAFAMEELMKQKIKIDWIVFGSSSGGTQAGLVLGKKIFKFPGKILGISIDEPETWLKNHVSKLAGESSKLIGKKISFTKDDVLANDAYCKSGYGVFEKGEREAIHLFASFEGILLDPVYSGRAAFGLIDLIRKGFFKKNETVLFWHTGGQPALFADKYSQKL